ncbi:MAG: NTP transferase domain-containing protein, partial [Thermoplasmata archaeon]|nr:NTP transferase domain-containing protein [Thermoplasmata archaeon]
MAKNNQNVAAMILGGGRGQRLYPLTKYRSKPAVPVAGKFRLIDIPISNCLHAGINNIFILTQFNSASLHRHIEETYKFDKFSRGFVQVLAAQQTYDSSSWYQGTADAVRQNLAYVARARNDSVLILSGDHLYKMDFNKMLDFHRDVDADLTIATLPVKRERANEFGILKASVEG